MESAAVSGPITQMSFTEVPDGAETPQERLFVCRLLFARKGFLAAAFSFIVVIVS